VGGGAAGQRGRRLGRRWLTGGARMAELSSLAKEGEEEEAGEEEEGEATAVAGA
jgi:hypothetical protein